MIKSILITIFATLLALSISSCSNKELKVAEATQTQEVNFGCKQENVPAPKWTCIPISEKSFVDVGIAPKSAAGMGHMRRVALANGRSNLAQQIKSNVQDKIRTYVNTTGVSDGETVDSVTTSFSEQVAKVNLEGSSAIDAWTAPSGALYVLVAIDKKGVNKQIQNNIKTTFKNDNAIHQESKAKSAFKEFSKEYE
jgi:hypothetical protein